MCLSADKVWGFFMRKVRGLWQYLRPRLLGVTETKERAVFEVDTLIESCPSGEVTGALFNFGRYLLDQNAARDNSVDQKATSIVAYGSAILAFLTTRESSWSHSPIRLLALLLIAALAISACVFAGLALRGARNWLELGEATWFPDHARFLADEDQLKRYYLTAMHQVFQENHRIVNQKADQMILAQLSVAGAGIFLGCVVLGGAGAALLRHLFC